jgi:hypothetical protein
LVVREIGVREWLIGWTVPVDDEWRWERWHIGGGIGVVAVAVVVESAEKVVVDDEPGVVQVGGPEEVVCSSHTAR